MQATTSIYNGDTLLFEDGSTIVLSGATFSNFNGDGQMQIGGIDGSGKSGSVLVFGYHKYESPY